MNKETLTKFLDSLNHGIDEKEIGIFKNILSGVKINEYDSPESLYYGLLRSFDVFINGYIKSEIGANEDVVFIFKNYKYLNNHFSSLFAKMEGSACSVDKSRAVIESILKYYQTGEEIKFDYDSEYTYHIPKEILNNHDDIINFYKGLKSLAFGHNNKYLRELYKLMHNEKESK